MQEKIAECVETLAVKVMQEVGGPSGAGADGVKDGGAKANAVSERLASLASEAKQLLSARTLL